MTGAETLNAALEPRPTFRGPLDDQKPRLVVNFGPDPWLLLAVGALVGLGAIMVFNVSWFHGQEMGDAMHFFRKHVTSIVLGIVAAAITSRIPSARLRQAAYPLLAIAIVLLVAVLIPGLGVRRSGAQRWFPLGPLSFQPTEIAKFAVVLYLAASIVRKGERIRTFSLGIMPHAVVAGTMAALLLLEPDFGTAALVCTLLVLMLFAGGVRPAHLFLPALAALPLGAYVLLAESYRLKRLLGFMSPDADPLGINFQLRQSFLAFGSGGLWGVGLGEGRQKMFYLPAAHTDFIFSVVGEELGLLGALVVLALFAVVAVRGFRIALRHGDRFASLLAFGVTLSLILQAAVNIGVVMGLLPTKGLTLPFVSYGGSAIIASLAQAGVLVALARETG